MVVSKFVSIRVIRGQTSSNQKGGGFRKKTIQIMLALNFLIYWVYIFFKSWVFLADSNHVNAPLLRIQKFAPMEKPGHSL